MCCEEEGKEKWPVLTVDESRWKIHRSSLNWICKKIFMFMAGRWAFFLKKKKNSNPASREHSALYSQLRVIVATPSYSTVFWAGLLVDSLMTGMFHLNPSQGVSLWGFLFLGEDGKACSFCLLYRWRRKLRGTLQCTVVLSSAKAPLRMSECFWLCGWRSGSAIQLTCS